jgi:general secretion pathway protein I
MICYRLRCRQKGLTLIEVLVALAIVSIALVAVVKATVQSIRGTTHLQDKTLATWVAWQIVNEVRTGLLILPKTSEKLNETTTMLNRKWAWQASQEETPNKHIMKIMVAVFAQTKKDNNGLPIVVLESYVYHGN